jgi:hypothetical protein
MERSCSSSYEGHGNTLSNQQPHERRKVMYKDVVGLAKMLVAL